MNNEKMSQEERNEIICTEYRNGSTQDDLANRFSITKVRVGQILRRSGFVKSDRPKPPSVTRKSFIGVYLPVWVKTVVTSLAKTECKSMSAFVSELIMGELKQRNISAAVETKETNDVPLPLEDHE